MKLNGRFAATLIAVTGLLTATVGCSPSAPLAASSRPDQPGAPAASSFVRFTDIPVPSGAKMDLERSLVLGDRETWIGRLVMSVAGGGSKAYDFYFAEMPRFGWAPITAVRSETSVLTYSRGERVATVQIQERTIAGAAVSITVSPRGRPGPAGPATGGDGAVRIAPLR